MSAARTDALFFVTDESLSWWRTVPAGARKETPLPLLDVDGCGDGDEGPCCPGGVPAVRSTPLPRLSDRRDSEALLPATPLRSRLTPRLLIVTLRGESADGLPDGDPGDESCIDRARTGPVGSETGDATGPG
jgi:hypothetical protein